MAPIISSSHVFTRRMAEVTKPTDPITLIVEAWAQGFMVGAILIMLCITVSNYRRGVLLHKLILLELVFGSFHGTFIFNDAPVYGWYLSVTAIFLIISWNLHNVIAWIKVRPFIGRKTSLVFIGTIALVQPYWILEIYADFTYFNNISAIYLKTRVFEALFRDPWWVYTTCCLLYNIRTRYSFGLWELMCFSPRFAVMLIAMILSIIFTIIDICAVTSSFSSNIPIGINPFWKLAFVFKLLTDSVILDDFKTALDKLSARNISRVECQWAQDWAAAKPTSDHRERRLTSLESSLNETKISRGPSEESSVLEHGQGIAVTREINVNSYAAERVELAMPLKCFNK